MSTITTSHPAAFSRTPRPARALAVIGASAAALAVWAVGSSMAALNVHFGSDPAIHHVGAGSVATVSLLAGLAAWGLLAGLERTAAHARTIWTAIALVVLAVSLAGPIGGAVGGATTAALICVHLAAGGVLILALARTARRR
jgi:cytochrome bd-type quinol oxidase subunit 1